jgi:low temperature requirement protein LtrA
MARRATFDAGSLRVVAATTGGAAVVLAIGSFFSSQQVALVPGLCLGIALALALLPMFTVLLGRACSDGRLDREHLGERMGQLVIIVLGESFVRLVLALHREEEIPSPVFLVLTFVVVYCLWVIYFRGVLPAGVPSTAGRVRTWLAAHYLFMLGAIGAASGLAALTLEPLDVAIPETAPYRTALPLIYAMTALALLAWVGRERTGPEYRVHLVAAGLLLLTVLAGVFVVPAADWTSSVACAVVVGDAIAVSWLRRRQPQEAETHLADPASQS